MIKIRFQAHQHQCLVLGPMFDTSSKDFDFPRKVQQLPFKLNMGEHTCLTRSRQARIIDVICNSQEVFSLHDQNLGYCNKITHTVTTITDTLVSLPHFMLPHQFPGEAYPMF